MIKNLFISYEDVIFKYDKSARNRKEREREHAKRSDGINLYYLESASEEANDEIPTLVISYDRISSRMYYKVSFHRKLHGGVFSEHLFCRSCSTSR